MKRPTGFESPIPRPANAEPKKRVLSQPATERSAPAHSEVNPAKEQRRLNQERRRIERAEYRRFTRESSRRRRNWWVLMITVAVIILAVLTAVFSPLFAIRQITVTGTNRIDPAAIDAALSEEYGLPLPLLNQDELAEKLAAFPLIESYAIESQLPDTLVIRLIERTPLLAQQTSSGFVLFDAAGVVIEESDARPENYPLLQADATGAEASGFAPAVSVLRALPASLLAQVDSVLATTKDDVRLSLNNSSKVVIWGDASETSLKVTLLNQLLQNLPNGQIYDVSSTSAPSVR